jgi:hypothetical protein
MSPIWEAVSVTVMGISDDHEPAEIIEPDYSLVI